MPSSEYRFLQPWSHASAALRRAETLIAPQRFEGESSSDPRAGEWEDSFGELGAGEDCCGEPVRCGQQVEKVPHLVLKIYGNLGVEGIHGNALAVGPEPAGRPHWSRPVSF